MVHCVPNNVSQWTVWNHTKAINGVINFPPFRCVANNNIINHTYVFHAMTSQMFAVAIIKTAFGSTLPFQME